MAADRTSAENLPAVNYLEVSSCPRVKSLGTYVKYFWILGHILCMPGSLSDFYRAVWVNLKITRGQTTFREQGEI